MMNVLDALRYRLTPPGTSDLEGEPLMEMLGRSPRQLPPGLPLVVQDSILKRPSYGEGERYSPREMGGEQNLPNDDPRNREYRLNDLLGFNEYMRRNSQQAWPEDSFATPLQPGQSPYATPEGPSPAMDTLPGGATRISASALDLLKRQLGQPTQQELADLARRQRNWEAQRDSPVYGEDEIMAPEPWWNEALGPEKHLFDEAQRNEQLARDLGDVSDVATSSTQAVPEGSYLSRRPVGMSPFASPLNQFLQLGRRAPLSMY